MALLTNSPWIDIALAFSTLILLLVLFFNERYKYWKTRGIPYVKPLFLFGSSKENILGKENIFETYCKIYNRLKGERLGGFFEFHEPNLMIRDPDLIYRVLVKDFAHFHDRGVFVSDPEHDPLTNTITALAGQEWRTLRHKLSPTFTSGKLKGMIEQIYNSGEHLLSEMDKLAEDKRAVECRQLLSEFTIDVIASCAFGLQFQLDSPDGQKFKNMITNAFPQSKLAFLIMLIRTKYLRFANILGLKTFPKKATEYFVNLSKETVRHRKEGGIVRNDFLQLLLNLRENEQNKNFYQEEDAEDDEVVNQLKFSSLYSNDLQNKKVMTDECLAATSFFFLAAGTEVSTVLMFAVYCLATNSAVQKELQREIDQVLSKHQTFNHQAVKDMVYLDKVLCESMRMFPTGAVLNRVCTIPYRVPGSDVVIEEGTRVTIPVWAIHRDPEHYPDPDIFNPERFPEPNYKPTPTFLPFGDGPRICIAMRFAILEMKVCMARIMSKFTVSLSKETKLPLKFEPKGMIPKIQGGLKILVTKRT